MDNLNKEGRLKIPSLRELEKLGFMSVFLNEYFFNGMFKGFFLKKLNKFTNDLRGMALASWPLTNNMKREVHQIFMTSLLKIGVGSLY